MKKVGIYLRERYIDNNFINSEYKPEEVYVRSSISKRCLKSMNLLLTGMFPEEYNSENYNPISIETIPSAFDYVYVNFI